MKDLKFICAEEWRNCPDYNSYEVSNLGNVRNKKNFKNIKIFY